MTNSPFSLFTTIKPDPPASCTASALSWKEQTPRSRTTTEPTLRGEGESQRDERRNCTFPLIITLTTIQHLQTQSNPFPLRAEERKGSEERTEPERLQSASQHVESVESGETSMELQQPEQKPKFTTLTKRGSKVLQRSIHASAI